MNESHSEGSNLEQSSFSCNDDLGGGVRQVFAVIQYIEMQSKVVWMDVHLKWDQCG